MLYQGLDKCKYAMTGAAPISADTLGFFASLGIQINEVYGLPACLPACLVRDSSAQPSPAQPMSHPPPTHPSLVGVG